MHCYYEFDLEELSALAHALFKYDGETEREKEVVTVLQRRFADEFNSTMEQNKANMAKFKSFCQNDLERVLRGVDDDK